MIEASIVRRALSALALLGACRAAGSGHARLIDELAGDTTIVFTPAGPPTESAIGRLLDRLGIPSNPRLAAVDSGCVLGERADVSRPGNTLDQRLPREQRVVCQLRDDLPAIEITLYVDEASGWPDSLSLWASPRRSGAEPLQTVRDLDVESSYPRATRYFFAVDLNGDGTREVLLMHDAGATGNKTFLVWQFDTASKRLVIEARPEAETPVRLHGRPCVRQQRNGGAAGLTHTDRLSCWTGAAWESVWWNVGEYLSGIDAVRRQVGVRVGGVEHTVRDDTIPMTTWRKGERD